MMKPPALPILSDIVRDAANQLQQAGLENAAREARILCAAILGIDRAALLTQQERLLSADEVSRLGLAITRRAAHEPLARILGRQEFWGLEFALNAATLVPRPDSETLIMAALAQFPDRHQPLRVLDLGTGSGCLLLALLHEYPHSHGVGVDLADDAITIAQHNAAHLVLNNRAHFVVTDWHKADFVAALATLTPSPPYDLIISNPPYIAEAVIPTLDRTVQHYDPIAALNGGADGLAAYRQLLSLLPNLTHAQSTMIFEIGYDQGITVPALCQQAGYQAIALQQDLAGQPRCVILRQIENPKKLSGLLT